MKEWRKIFEIDEIKLVVEGKPFWCWVSLESTNEVLESVVDEYVKKFGKDKKNKEDKNSDNEA